MKRLLSDLRDCSCICFEEQKTREALYV